MKRPRASGRVRDLPAAPGTATRSSAWHAGGSPLESAFFDELAKHRSLESCAVLVQRPWLGERNDAFGRGLLKSFLFVISEKEGKPSTLIFLAGAIALACEGSPVLPALARMESDGVSVMVCGASLNHFKSRPLLRAGYICNMHDIAEVLLRTRRVVSL